MSMKTISSGLDTNVRRVILVLAAFVVACGLALGLGLTREARASSGGGSKRRNAPGNVRGFIWNSSA